MTLLMSLLTLDSKKDSQLDWAEMLTKGGEKELIWDAILIKRRYTTEVFFILDTALMLYVVYLGSSR
jgi:hypothetical protein